MKARYKYNKELKKCWVVYESLGTTPYSPDEFLHIIIPEDVVKFKGGQNFLGEEGKFRTQASQQEDGYKSDLQTGKPLTKIDREKKKKGESPGSWRVEYELPLIFSNSFQAKFKHFEATLIIEHLTNKIITATLKDYPVKFRTCGCWELERENEPKPKNEEEAREKSYCSWYLDGYRLIDTVWGWGRKAHKEKFGVEILDNYEDDLDCGTAVYDELTDTYSLEYGHPKIFHVYWDEYDKEKDWLFFFDYEIHLVNKDKDVKKPYYYQWDFSPSLVGYVFQTLRKHLPFFLESKKIVQLPGQNGVMLTPWQRSGYSVSNWRYRDLPVDRDLDKELVEKVGSEFIKLVKNTPYSQREKFYQEWMDRAEQKGMSKEELDNYRLFSITEGVAENLTGQPHIAYVPDEISNYDFYYETKEKWEAREGGDLPELVISFLPTMFPGQKVPRSQKLTGTKWVSKLYEVFIKHGVPVVLKCYQGFIHTHLYQNHREWYDKISAITILPRSINLRETGGSDLLVWFNCPKLGKETESKVKWDGWDGFKQNSFFKGFVSGHLTARQFHFYRNPKLDPRFEGIAEPDIRKIIQMEKDELKVFLENPPKTH